MSSSSALNRVWTVPNIISLARLVLAIVLFALIEGVVGRQDLAALVLFVFAAATDWVDGVVCTKIRCSEPPWAEFSTRSSIR